MYTTGCLKAQRCLRRMLPGIHSSEDLHRLRCGKLVNPVEYGNATGGALSCGCLAGLEGRNVLLLLRLIYFLFNSVAVVVRRGYVERLPRAIRRGAWKRPHFRKRGSQKSTSGKTSLGWWLRTSICRNPHSRQASAHVESDRVEVERAVPATNDGHFRRRRFAQKSLFPNFPQRGLESRATTEMTLGRSYGGCQK